MDGLQGLNFQPNLDRPPDKNFFTAWEISHFVDLFGPRTTTENYVDPKAANEKFTWS